MLNLSLVSSRLAILFFACCAPGVYSAQPPLTLLSHEGGSLIVDASNSPYTANPGDRFDDDQGTSACAIRINRGSSFTGTSIEVESVGSGTSSYALYANGTDAFLKLDALAESRTQINLHGNQSRAVYLYNTNSSSVDPEANTVSEIHSTVINHYGTDGYGLYVNNSTLAVDRVEIHALSQTPSGGHALFIRDNGSLIGSHVAISIEGGMRYAVSAYNGGKIDLSHVSVVNRASDGRGIYVGEGGNTITLTDGKIVTSSTGYLINGHGSTGSMMRNDITLNRIDISESGNIYIRAGLTSVVIIDSVGSLRGGIVCNTANGARFDLTLDHSDWVVDSGSQVTNLTLQNAASLTLALNSQTDFSDITALSIALANGTILNINASDDIASGDTFTIFNCPDISLGSLVINHNLAPGFYWDTSRLGTDGSITLLRQIPEPSACLLLFAAATGMLIRRNNRHHDHSLFGSE